MTALLALVGAALVVALLVAYGLAEYERGKAVEKAQRQAAEAQIRRQQEAVINEQRTPEDAAKALDEGKF